MMTRNQELASLFKSGATIVSLADKFGISKQRIHQILRKQGVTASDGGVTVRIQKRSAAFVANKDQFCGKKYGCTWEQYQEILEARTSMGWKSGPLSAYYSQRGNAKYRGIPFNLTLWEWWNIWKESGKWEERGLGMRGYVMCRKGDEGAYEVGNVFIDTSMNNVASAKRKARDLPTGVSARVRQRGTVYAALRSINGKLSYLGTFETPDEAHSAYLRAV